MLLAFSITSIILAAIIAVVMRLRGVRLAYIWAFLFFTVIVIWLLLVFLDPVRWQSLRIPGFFSTGTVSIDIVFTLNEQNRIAGIGLFSMLLAYLATETTGPKGNRSFYRWIEVLIHFSISWIILLSDHSWTLLIGWTCIIIVSLINTFLHKHLNERRFIPLYLLKITGVMALGYVVSNTYQINPVNLFERQMPNIGLWIIIAVFLQSEVFLSRNSIITQKYDHKHQIIMHFFLFCVIFFTLTQISVLSVSPFLSIAIRIVSIICATIFAIRWYLGKNEYEHFNDLIRTLALISTYLYFSENQNGFLFFLLMILPFSWLFLYTERDNKINIVVIVMIFFMSGFPFSLLYTSIEELILARRVVYLIFLMVPISFILAGFQKFSFQDRGNFTEIERLNQGVYTIGLLFPLIGCMIVLLTQRPQIVADHFLYGGAQILLFLIILVIGKQKNDLLSNNISLVKKTIQNSPSIRTIHKNYNQLVIFVENGLQFVAMIFEEKGGILWSIVFLSLLLSIITSEVGGFIK